MIWLIGRPRGFALTDVPASGARGIAGMDGDGWFAGMLRRASRFLGGPQGFAPTGVSVAESMTVLPI